MKTSIKRLALALAFSALAAGGAAAQSHLRVGLAEDPDVLDPTLARTFVGRVVFAALCDKLFDIDEKLNVVPQLATGYEWSADTKTLTIKLRTDVTFHDGEKMDAEAVRYSLDRHLNLQGSFRRSEINVVKSIDVVDPQTIKVSMGAPFAPLLAQFTDRAGMMVSPKAAERLGDLPAVEEAAEFLGAAAAGLFAHFVELLQHFGRLGGLVQLAAQPVHDGCGHARRQEEPQPDDVLELGQVGFLGHRAQLGQLRHAALGCGDGDGAHLAGEDIALVRDRCCHGDGVGQRALLADFRELHQHRHVDAGQQVHDLVAMFLANAFPDGAQHLDFVAHFVVTLNQHQQASVLPGEVAKCTVHVGGHGA